MQKLDVYRFLEKGTMQGACRYLEYYFAFTKIMKQSTVLDLGSGLSAFPSLLSKANCKVYCTETNKQAIDYQTSNKIIARLVRSEDLPFADNAFNVVTAISAIEHFENDELTVAEVKRVLTDDGLFIVTIPVGSKLIKNRYENQRHPREKIYSEKEYKRVFLKDFVEVEKLFYQGSDKVPTDYIPHKTWKDQQSVEVTARFADNTGLCVVLKKK